MTHQFNPGATAMFTCRSHQRFMTNTSTMLLVVIAALGMAACSKEEAKAPQARPPTEVSVVTVAAQDTPISYEFVGQSESSRQVQIVARTNGFLDKRVYTEGSMVKAGQVMFLMDPKPFRAALEASNGVLAEQQARLQTANANLEQVKPLAAQHALSQKELDDATGQQQASSAAVQTARAEVEQERLNLSYTTITSPVTGLSSYARVEEGAYVNTENSLLTYVSQIDPIWLSFTLSENELLSYRTNLASGKLRAPEGKAYVVEAILADGSVFPHKGAITFADAEFNQKTGTYLLRATLPNPGGVLRPGQFVRVRVSGFTQPGAILVPQKAVVQGAQGHFVFVINKEGKSEMRPVKVGEWHGDDWIINQGLAAGDVVVTDGVLKLAPGATVKIVAAPTPAPAAPAPAQPAPAEAKPAKVGDNEVPKN